MIKGGCPMREIIFKNLTTRDRRRRDLWIQEVSNENGFHAEIQKRCVFLVKSHQHLPDLHAVERWINDHSDDSKCRLRNLTVTRKENSKTGAKHFSFKAVGSFYAVMGEEVFSIGFIQTYEVTLEASWVDEEGGTWS